MFRAFGLFLTISLWISSAMAIPSNGHCARILVEDSGPVQAQYSPSFLPNEKVTYTVLDQDGDVPASSLLPEVPDDRKLIVVFSNAHTYIQYGNIRLDSKSKGALSVTSFKRENSRVKGDVAIVLYDLSDEAVADLQARLEQHQDQTGYSCAKFSSPFIKAANEQALPRERWTSSGVFQSLIKAKLQGSPIEIYSLRSQGIEPAYGSIRKDEIGFMIYHGLLVGGPLIMTGFVAKLVSLCL